ncbi:methyltransferase domain-containing protein [Candidatus Uhrbacteria bacterium]|nr:methyltransferase domain-containing protein [Candidatus Uhrbacteria bacterium]
MESLLLKGGTNLINVPELLKRLDIGSGQTVADLGCGGGGHFVAPTALMVGSGGLVYAVDIQKKVLNSLEASLKIQNIGNVKIVWSDLERVGAAQIPEKSCDVAILANVLFQNKNHASMMQEAARLVRDGGKVVVIDWKKTGGVFGPPQELRIAPDSVQRIGMDGNLGFLETFDVGDFHYAVVFKK